MHDYVLITLPQSVRYSDGISGEIRIDVYGNVLEWDGAKDSATFRSKVEKLRQQLDSSRKAARFGRDRNELAGACCCSRLLRMVVVEVVVELWWWWCDDNVHDDHNNSIVANDNNNYH